MRVGTEKRCGCRDPLTGKPAGPSCPRLRAKGHGKWAWRVRVADHLAALAGGRRFVRGSGYGTKAEAQAAGEAFVARLRAGQTMDSKATVAPLLEEMLAQKKRLKASTRRSYRTHLDLYLLPYLGPVPCDRLAPTHFHAAYTQILAGNDNRRYAGKRPVGPATIARIHATAKALLGMAVKQRRIPYNVALHVELPDVMRPEVEPWSAAETGAFLDACAADRLTALFELIALHGLRRGEAVGARWADLDDAAATYTVRQTILDVGGQLLVSTAKSRAGERKVDLDAGTLGSLMAHRLRQDAERAAWGAAYESAPTLPGEDGAPVALPGLMFTREDGAPLRPEYVTRHMQAIAGRAGLPRKRLHDLRHGSASIQLAAGVALAVVSKRLGHSSISITADTYSHRWRGWAGRPPRQPPRWCRVPRCPLRAHKPKTISRSDHRRR